LCVLLLWLKIVKDILNASELVFQKYKVRKWPGQLIG
jgi:hypothetical protein